MSNDSGFELLRWDLKQMLLLWGRNDLKKSFLWSLLGHVVIIILMVLDLGFSLKKQDSASPAIMMVDLTKIKLADKTNLPQKTVAPKKKITPPPQKVLQKVEAKKVPKQTMLVTRL